MQIILLLVPIVVLVLSGCISTPENIIETVVVPIDMQKFTSPDHSPEPSPTIDQQVLPTISASPTSEVTPQAIIEVTQSTVYSITAILDYADKSLVVVQDIHYPNTYTSTMMSLEFSVAANRFPNIFHLRGLYWHDDTDINDYSLEETILRIPLTQPLAPQEAIQLSIVYELTLPALVESNYIGPTPFGFTDRQINLVDWYPFIPPYSPQNGFTNNKPWLYGEYLVYPVADTILDFHVTNPPDELVIAASGAASNKGDWYHYELENARNFVLSLSPDYEVLDASVGDVVILSYYFPEHTSAGTAILKTTVDAFSLYNRLFGSYPYSSLTVIEADFLHGMEYQSLHFLSKGFYNLYQGTQGEYLVAIGAHETAHQWWYGLVANDQAIEPWLDEALCTFSELLFYEHYYPDVLDWWWWARIYYYAPDGLVDSTLYETGGYRPYVNAIYLRGALFLDELKDLAGDEAFFNFLQQYFIENIYGISSSEKFFNLLEQTIPIDLNTLIAKYFSPNQ